MKIRAFLSVSILLISTDLFSQTTGCYGLQPQISLPDIATKYATADEEFMMETQGESIAFQMLDYFSPDASFFASALKNTAPEKINYTWLEKDGRLSIKQKTAGLFYTPIDRSFSHGNVWQIFVNTRSIAESADSYNGIYLKARVSGENFDRYILLMGNKQSSTFWFGEYNSSTNTFTSFNAGDNPVCNFIMHPSVKEYGSVDYSLYRNGNYLFLRLNSYFLYNYEITNALVAFDNIVEAGIITLNAQETEVSHVQWNNFSSMSGVTLAQYEQNEQEEKDKIYTDNQDYDDTENLSPGKTFYGTYLIYYGRQDIVSVTHAYQIYANQFPSESELNALKNEKYYADAPEYELLIGADFIPELDCDEAFEMLEDMYYDAGLENYSADYCLEDYELDN